MHQPKKEMRKNINETTKILLKPFGGTLVASSFSFPSFVINSPFKFNFCKLKGFYV